MSGLQPVVLVGVPIAIQLETSQHYDELMREFDDIAASDANERTGVPGRLLELYEQLRTRFGGFSDAAQEQLAGAVRDDRASVDLHYEVPPEAATACVELGAMLDEADQYCAAGRYLLTLRTPPRAAAYRRWFLDQFIQQLGGAAPTPWHAWVAQHAPELA